MTPRISFRPNLFWPSQPARTIEVRLARARQRRCAACRVLVVPASFCRRKGRKPVSARRRGSASPSPVPGGPRLFQEIKRGNCIISSEAAGISYPGSLVDLNGPALGRIYGISLSAAADSIPPPARRGRSCGAPTRADGHKSWRRKAAREAENRLRFVEGAPPRTEDLLSECRRVRPGPDQGADTATIEAGDGTSRYRADSKARRQLREESRPVMPLHFAIT